MNEQSAFQATCFSMVIFGNVLGSSGSVVPLFREQIKNGVPVTSTHEDITRYFMSISEAAQLVMQTGAMATGGDVFVLDMGEPVRIYDLARKMIELSGLSVRDDSTPDGDIEISITGLRPGEKLFEELLIDDNTMPSKHRRIIKAQEEFLGLDVLTEQLDQLRTTIEQNNVAELRFVLKKLVLGYEPQAELVDWIHLAQHNQSVTAH